MDVTMLANGMILSGFAAVALLGGIIYLTRDRKKNVVNDIDDNHKQYVKNVLAQSDMINLSKVPKGKGSHGAVYTQITTIGDINSNRNKKRKKRK